jgi:methylated-DNA-[protein]-cysteine S-methyltransferase
MTLGEQPARVTDMPCRALEQRVGVTSHSVVSSPLGQLTFVARDHRLIGLYFPGHWHKPDCSTFGDKTVNGAVEAQEQLAEYLNGDRRTFDVPAFANGSEFQRRVWDLLRQVPYGETATYGQLARELADGTTPQEVGAAVGRNPLCILIPCHRIISSTGKLTGYAGGLARKQFLLDLERDVVDGPTRLF